jgi:4a-hydroxytetrahydrobiopterin dehydratase
MTRLTDDEISRGLQGLAGWERSGDAIVRTVRFSSFLEGIRFIDRVAELAEAADHHPDIDIRYRNVQFALVTHDEGGLTEKDLSLARVINQSLAALKQGTSEVIP